MPTAKQLAATKKMVENGGNVSQAMRDVGYSPNTAKTPQKLTDSDGYKSITKELQDELGNINITPKKLARVIKQGLSAKSGRDVMVINKSAGKITDIEYKRVLVPDHTVRHKFLDTALKIFAAYPQEDKTPTTLILAQFKSMANAYIEDTAPIEGEVANAA